MPTANIFVCFCCYLVFFIQIYISRNHHQRLINDEGRLNSRPGNLIVTPIIGILWLGLVPAALLKFKWLNLITGSELPRASLIFLYLLIFMLVILVAIKQSDISGTGHQQEHGDFTTVSNNQLIRYFFTRSLFLFAYELFFWGFLLFESIGWLGVPGAVIMNIILYTGIHMFNSKKEMLACIPFGLLVCLLSILFNAVWPAMLLHTGFSLAYELNGCRYYFHSFKKLSL